MKLTEKQYEELLEIGISLTVEKNHGNLLKLIMKSAMDITNCDGGALYLYQDGELHFKIMRMVSRNLFQGGEEEEMDVPPLPLEEQNACAYSAIHGEIVNITDVDRCERFDFSGSRKYDAHTGYHTQSMLVAPLKDRSGELIGVLQLVNAMSDGRIVPFDPGYEKAVFSLASQASISIENLRYLREIKDMMYSYVGTMATIIDERSPYNGSHTKNVTRYASEFVDYLNRQYEAGQFPEYFDDDRKEQLVMAASLHDIGKMSIPLSIMNKSTKLVHHLDEIVNRYKLLKSCFKIDFYENRLSQEDYEKNCRYLEEAEALVRRINALPDLPAELEPRIRELAGKTYVSPEGEEIPYLTEEEADCLLIRRGTLTPRERKVMESHVVVTSHILSMVNFSTHYCNVPRWAGAHHEFLDGSGYPNHLTAQQMPTEIRILSLVDIFEALIAVDRPYKKPMPLEEAFRILTSMAEEGKLDRRLVSLFRDYVEGR